MSARSPDFQAMPEAAVVLAAQAGDRVAFTELVRRSEGWLRALLRRFCDDSGEADDLAQETLFRAWRQLHKLREPQAFNGWLRKLAVNRFVDQRRLKQLVVDGSARADDLSGNDAPHHSVIAQVDVERLLKLLSESERMCIVLNLGEGLSHADIVALSGIPLGTVKSHIARGLAKLRRHLGESNG